MDVPVAVPAFGNSTAVVRKSVVLQAHTHEDVKDLNLPDANPSKAENGKQEDASLTNT